MLLQTSCDALQPEDIPLGTFVPLIVRLVDKKRPAIEVGTGVTRPSALLR